VEFVGGNGAVGVGIERPEARGRAGEFGGGELAILVGVEDANNGMAETAAMPTGTTGTAPTATARRIGGRLGGGRDGDQGGQHDGEAEGDGERESDGEEARAIFHFNAIHPGDRRHPKGQRRKRPRE
jgi:hypothetical protein